MELTEVDTLPRTEVQSPVSDRNVDAHTRDNALCVCWHIVQSVTIFLNMEIQCTDVEIETSSQVLRRYDKMVDILDLHIFLILWVQCKERALTALSLIVSGQWHLRAERRECFVGQVIIQLQVEGKGRTVVAQVP